MFVIAVWVIKHRSIHEFVAYSFNHQWCNSIEKPADTKLDFHDTFLVFGLGSTLVLLVS